MSILVRGMKLHWTIQERVCKAYVSLCMHLHYCAPWLNHTYCFVVLLFIDMTNKNQLRDFANIVTSFIREICNF